MASADTDNPVFRDMLIGYLLRNGQPGMDLQPSPRERRSAMGWFLKAAAAGVGMESSMPKLEVASCFHFGDCARKDLEQAVRLYQELLLADPSPLPQFLMLLAEMERTNGTAQVVHSGIQMVMGGKETKARPRAARVNLIFLVAWF